MVECAKGPRAFVRLSSLEGAAESKIADFANAAIGSSLDMLDQHIARFEVALEAGKAQHQQAADNVDKQCHACDASGVLTSITNMRHP